MLQREGESTPHQSEPRLDLAELGADASLETERSRKEVGPSCLRGLFFRGEQERERVMKLTRSLQVSGQRQAFGGGVCRLAGGGKRRDSRLTGLDRSVPVPLQFKDAGKATLGLGHHGEVSCGTEAGSGLLPGSRCSGQVSRPLGTRAELVEGCQPLDLGTVLWPELQGSLQGTRCISVGMNRARRIGGGQERSPPLLELPSG